MLLLQAMLAGGLSPATGEPTGLNDGLRQAGQRLGNGFESAASALVLRPLRTLSAGSMSGAVKRAFSAAPSAMLAPASEAAAAVRCTLMGARRSIDPAATADT
jgi:hypothetical protein